MGVLSCLSLENIRKTNCWSPAADTEPQAELSIPIFYARRSEHSGKGGVFPIQSLSRLFIFRVLPAVIKGGSFISRRLELSRIFKESKILRLSLGLIQFFLFFKKNPIFSPVSFF